MATQTELLSPRSWISGLFFQKAHEAMLGSFVSDVATVVQSEQESETYKWLDEIPGLTEWTGPRPLDGLTSQSYTLANKTFTAGIKLDRDDIRRDKSGQIAIRIGELAARTAQHPEQLLTTRMEENGLAFDGNAFFGSTHAGPTFDNAVDADISTYPLATHGTVASPSIGEVGFAIMEGMKALLNAKDAQGLPLNPGTSQFGVMVPVDLSDSFTLAIASPTLEQGGANPMTTNGGRFGVSLVVNPYLSSAWDTTVAGDAFMVWAKDSQVRPFILQQEVAPRFDFLGEGTEQAIMNKAHLALSEYSGNVGYGRFTSAVKITLV